MDIFPYNELSEQSGSSGMKNAVSCAKLADILGGEVLPINATADENCLIFPYHPMTDVDYEACERMSRAAPVYGAVVPHGNMADKGMLHELVSEGSCRPEWYSAEFARGCLGAVLPGYTVFTRQDAVRATEQLADVGHSSVVLKDPSATRGEGQCMVTAQSIHSILRTMNETTVRSKGLVVEAGIPQDRLIAYSVGTVAVGEHMASWVGELWSDIDRINGGFLFGGNRMTVVKGDLDTLARQVAPAALKMAIAKSNTVHSLYPSTGAQVYRATYDVLQDAEDDSLGGVVDPSLRPSASTPGEIVALAAMAQRHQSKMSLEVCYVRPEMGHLSHPEAQVFARTSTAVITTRVLD